jgi:hypothetical protein
MFFPYSSPEDHTPGPRLVPWTGTLTVTFMRGRSSYERCTTCAGLD